MTTRCDNCEQVSNAMTAGNACHTCLAGIMVEICPGHGSDLVDGRCPDCMVEAYEWPEENITEICHRLRIPPPSRC